MIGAFVLDVSATCHGAGEDESTPAWEEMLNWAGDGSELYVPSLWTWEILNTVAVVIKRKRISASRGREFLEQSATLNFRIEGPPQLSKLPPLHALANLHQLTAYDTAYLDLAKSRALPLATFDHELRKAAVAEGIVVL